MCLLFFYPIIIDYLIDEIKRNSFFSRKKAKRLSFVSHPSKKERKKNNSYSYSPVHEHIYVSLDSFRCQFVIVSLACHVRYMVIFVHFYVCVL